MCLAVPAQIVELGEDGLGVVDHAGARREISLILIEEPRVGDYVILHAGFAIHKIDEDAAKETLMYLSQLAGAWPPDTETGPEG
ncbi:MAG: HypC/HybG/HupF family hydrogenase formation chaperone [Thermodesulfobacteriota bacterium]